MLRVVLDANVVASGLITPGGTCGRILAIGARGGAFRMILSPAILREYRRILLYPKVSRYHGLSEAEVRAYVRALEFVSDVVPGALGLEVVASDPDDDKYVVAAVEGMATHVVSGDHHLLDIALHDGVRMISPAMFLHALLKGGAG